MILAIDTSGAIAVAAVERQICFSRSPGFREHRIFTVESLFQFFLTIKQWNVGNDKIFRRVFRNVFIKELFHAQPLRSEGRISGLMHGGPESPVNSPVVHNPVAVMVVEQYCLRTMVYLFAYFLIRAHLGFETGIAEKFRGDPDGQ